jgi:DNA-binding response OmpR family regulator
MNSLARQNILVVHDELEVRQLMHAFLERRGYHVVTAATDLEALHLAGEMNFDLAIFDVALSEADGLELLATFKQLHPSLPVIMLTGMGYDDELLQEALEKGADAYVAKTLPLDQILMEVHRALRLFAKKALAVA